VAESTLFGFGLDWLYNLESREEGGLVRLMELGTTWEEKEGNCSSGGLY
jgi:hypothetical protein